VKRFLVLLAFALIGCSQDPYAINTCHVMKRDDGFLIFVKIYQVVFKQPRVVILASDNRFLPAGTSQVVTIEILKQDFNPTPCEAWDNIGKTK